RRGMTGGASRDRTKRRAQGALVADDRPRPAARRDRGRLRGPLDRRHRRQPAPARRALVRARRRAAPVRPHTRASALAVCYERYAARRVPWWLMIGPGLLLAATGVGSGDLATGAIAGSLLGPAVLWAVLAGALLKFVVTEGLARWQLATGETLLEGAVRRLGPVVIWLFFPYLFLWSFFVGSAQVSASGVTLHAILPVFDDPRHGKIVFGIVSGLAALALVWFGGYKAFERTMQVCIGLMFAMVVATSVLLWPGTAAVLEGLFVPAIPHADGEGFTWTIALIGGVGGTLTVLCYGYWLREEGRTAPE